MKPKKQKTKKDNSKYVLVAKVSLFWISLAMIAVAFFYWGQAQYDNGKADGIDEAATILNINK